MERNKYEVWVKGNACWAVAEIVEASNEEEARILAIDRFKRSSNAKEEAASAIRDIGFGSICITETIDRRRTEVIPYEDRWEDRYQDLRYAKQDGDAIYAYARSQEVC